MAKSTIQVLLEAKDLDFLATLMQTHHLRNNSEAVRLMIARYKGMEDWIRTKKMVIEQANAMKKARVVSPYAME